MEALEATEKRTHNFRDVYVQYYPDLPEGGDIFFPRLLLFRGFKSVFTTLFLIGLISLVAARW